MVPPTTPGIAGVLADYDRLVEVGIGNRTTVARTLVDRGVSVRATDVVDRAVPTDVAFVRDDVRRPDEAVYADAEAIYALRLPPELQRPAWRVARSVGADFLFTTLGGDPALVPAEPRTVVEGTLYVSAHTGGSRPATD
ncbi:MAG: UPF0146 family protein [Halanaeroarchaeum sp.]